MIRDSSLSVGRMTLAVLCVLAIVSTARCTPAATASPDLNEAAGMADYVRYAALHNAGLEAAFTRWKAALERVPQAGALPDPQFTYAYFIQEVETRVGPQQQKFGLTQRLPWFGKRDAREDAASEAAAAAEQVYQQAKLALFYRVKAAYHDYWYLARAIDLTRQHIKLMTNLERVARTRFKAGLAPNSAVIQAQVELGKLDDRLRSQEALRAPIVARLNAALNRPADLSLPWPRSLPEFEVAFADAEAMQWLAESNPDLERLDRLAAKEEAGLRLARKKRFPDISLGVDYVQTDDALMPGTPDSGKDPVMAMVSVNLPIWLGSYRAAEREARLRKAAAERGREDTAERLAADLALSLYHFRDAERKIDLYGDTLVPKAEQSLKVAQQGFETGGTTFLSLIDAERLLLEFELAGERARADRGKRLAEVEMLVGRELGTRNAERGISKGRGGDVTKVQTKCPVMGGKINKDLYADHEGQRIYVCCKGCLAPLEKDPEKYIEKLKKDGVTPDRVPPEDDSKNEMPSGHTGHHH